MVVNSLEPPEEHVHDLNDFIDPILLEVSFLFVADHHFIRSNRAGYRHQIGPEATQPTLITEHQPVDMAQADSRDELAQSSPAGAGPGTALGDNMRARREASGDVWIHQDNFSPRCSIEYSSKRQDA